MFSTITDLFDFKNLSQAFSELAKITKNGLKKALFPRSYRMDRLDALMREGRYLMNQKTLRTYRVEEVTYAGALLVDISGSVLKLDWVNELGEVIPDFIDDWLPAGNQSRVLYRMSIK